MTLFFSNKLSKNLRIGSISQDDCIVKKKIFINGKTRLKTFILASLEGNKMVPRSIISQ